MKPHDLASLERQIKDLRGSLTRWSDDRDFAELLNIIHRPGWTTPAEFTLVNGLVGSMLALTEAVAGLRQVLITGSGAVAASEELNPQPLPPKEVGGAKWAPDSTP